ncbi:DUF948 domain-containing protein [Paenibacillus radicis (ex Gao et al. 2016)]|uniref:DUF948 domain-containing protein n=1 Tax=Paenibacillus radicis (ex Gao et al. 2016) TaxID=1737354 RepID=A0A917LSN1_9BACL|nr:DUF948 domain-containing protein [Paenibacillus radicis (ex Gao et al. 2016)]GGG55393.1 hypothetical protein GCM10010918_05350 [Paenibacillus radicis (ex Gao et al. 2016)]
MDVMEWSAAIAAAAFVVLAAGMLLGIKAALDRLKAVQASAETMMAHMQVTAARLTALADPAEQTILTAQQQLQSVNRLFEAAGQIGESIEHTTTAVNRVSSVLSQSAITHAERAAEQRQIGEAFEWAELGMAAWQLWQTNRKRHNGTESDHPGEERHKNEGSE